MTKDDLQQIRELLDERFAAQDERIDKKLDERFIAQDKRIEERFAAQDERLDSRLAEQEQEFDAKLDTQLADQDERWEERLRTALETSNAVAFGQMTRYVDGRFDELKTELGDKMDRLQATMDGLAKRVADDDDERALMDHQLKRHESWIGQLAEVADVKLVPEP